MIRRLFASACVAVLLSLLSACATVQETGRRQVILMSPAQEAGMGVEAFSQLKKQEKISQDPALNARLQRIGTRVAAAVGRDLPEAKWEFVVFESDQVNAFALPGGKVGFYTGLIKLAASDDEIAVVMGHEVAHVTSRHGAERQSQAMLAGLGGVAIDAGLQGDKNRETWMLAYGVGATLGTLAYSRTHETEADEVGLLYAARAGYDPRAAVSFWSKMAAQESGNRPPKLLSTHPPSAERIANLRRLSASLMPIYEQARGSATTTVSSPSPAPATIKDAAAARRELEEFLKR